jgi:hypothetical protein
MSLFNRFRGYDDNGAEVAKLPIWPTITTVAEVLSGEITDVDAANRFGLSDSEIVEFAQVKSKVENDISSMVSSLVTAGIDIGMATTIAKAVVRNAVTQTLMRAELRYCDLNEFNASLGIA